MATIVSRPVVKLRRHTDDYFFAGMSLLILGSVFLGFARSYFLAGTVRAHLPSAIIHVHAVVFSSWILLFVAQTTLVSIGRVGWHKKLGIFGAVLACLMVIFGVLAAIDSSRDTLYLLAWIPPRFLQFRLRSCRYSRFWSHGGYARAATERPTSVS